MPVELPSACEDASLLIHSLRLFCQLGRAELAECGHPPSGDTLSAHTSTYAAAAKEWCSACEADSARDGQLHRNCHFLGLSLETEQSAADLEGEGALVPAPRVLARVQGHQVGRAAGKPGVHSHVGAPAIEVLKFCRQMPDYSLHRPYEEDSPAHTPFLHMGPAHSRSMHHLSWWL